MTTPDADTFVDGVATRLPDTDAVEVMVRPEQIQLARRGPNAPRREGTAAATVIGHTYQLQSTLAVTLTNTVWSPVGAPVTAPSSGTFSYTNGTLSASGLFYRVVAH